VGRFHAALSGQQKSTGKYAGRECWRGMPDRAASGRVCVAAATGRGWSRSSCRGHAATCKTPVAARSGRHNKVSQAGCNNEPDRSRRTHQDFDTEAKNQPLFSQAFRMRPTSGRAKTASVIDAINRRAATGTACRYLSLNSKQSIPAPVRVIRLQLRCNPDPRKSVRTRFFPSNSQFGGADGDAPV
jgi:hypothetical protein